MFDLINGLPVHALVVHGAVVLLPLAALGTIAIAVRPAWRLRYGALVALVAAAGTATVPVAVKSGEALSERVGDPGRHEDLGRTVLFFALPVLVLSVALWLLERQRARSDGGTGGPPPMVARAVAVVAVLASVALTVQVVRTGDAGSRVVWEGRVGSAPAMLR